MILNICKMRLVNENPASLLLRGDMI